LGGFGIMAGKTPSQFFRPIKELCGFPLTRAPLTLVALLAVVI
jgi:hypothetical protein